jgi:hypothetical protein
MFHPTLGIGNPRTLCLVAQTTHGISPAPQVAVLVEEPQRLLQASRHLNLVVI